MAKRVLIVDDEPNIVEALEFLLQGRGLEVRIARDGGEALRMIEEDKPDLVLLDVMLPVMNGYDICMRVRERESLRHIKIVMLSAKGYDAEVSKGMALGADLYVTKPFSTRELVAKVEQLLLRTTPA
jgi:two-component system alkaline phosphatase synthesis response regulator PhoP